MEEIHLHPERSFLTSACFSRWYTRTCVCLCLCFGGMCVIYVSAMCWVLWGGDVMDGLMILYFGRMGCMYLSTNELPHYVIGSCTS